MTEDSERHAATHGYAMVELQATQANDQVRVEQRVEDLRHELDAFQAEIGQAHSQVTQVEHEVLEAVEAEDAERTVTLWDEKHRLLDRISDLQREQLKTQQQLRSEIQAALVELGRERAELEQEEAGQDDDWRRLMTSVDALRDLVLSVERSRNQLRVREASWRKRLESLAGRELSVLTGASIGAGPEPGERPSVGPRPAGPAVANKRWSVYDVDSGTLVSTLPQLSRLLARWYPKLHSDEERVREFLREPNASPMPDQLRSELEAAGYLTTSRKPND